MKRKNRLFRLVEGIAFLFLFSSHIVDATPFFIMSTIWGSHHINSF